MGVARGTLRISRITASEGELSADVGGERVWYRVADAALSAERADPFLCAALLPAMQMGRNIVAEGVVSPELLRGLGELQSAFCAWYPGLQRVEIQAHAEAPAEARHAGTGSFFSGGVDGLYTFLRNRREITHLVFSRGVDMQIDNEALFVEVLAANQRLAGEFGVELVVIETNIRRMLTAFRMSWIIAHGGGLAGMAHVLGFPRMYVAASHGYDELFPWGSHVVTDHLWSTEGTRLIHDGLARRSEKMGEIGRFPAALDQLRVCWHDAGYNCQACEKCVRTRTTLRLLGLRSKALKPLDDVREIERHPIEDESGVSFYEDNLKLAREVGDIQVAAVLGRLIARWRRRQAFVEVDRAWLGGGVKRLLRLIRRPKASFRAGAEQNRP